MTCLHRRLTTLQALLSAWSAQPSAALVDVGRHGDQGDELGGDHHEGPAALRAHHVDVLPQGTLVVLRNRDVNDIVKTHFADDIPALYRGLGKGLFEDVAVAAGSRWYPRATFGPRTSMWPTRLSGNGFRPSSTIRTTVS